MFAVFARNDLRGVGRDSLLAGLLLAPLVWIALVRFVTPMVADSYDIDLTPYYPVILTGFLLLTSAIVPGGLIALLVLDERDAGTLVALKTTPVPLRTYIAYRATIAVVLATVFVVGTISASGLLPADLILPLIPIGVLTGLSALVICLTMLAFAHNKVEGIAVIRGLGILVAGLPLIPFFLDSDWQLLFSLIPTYWPAKAFWVAWEHGTWWPYLTVGTVFHLLLTWPLCRLFTKGVS
ncbi:fluoroquinolone transporter permease [Kibdelosporangium aridum]|uniref:Fluoroquinolone transporter permease n=1 Tax=Kibdelosporangium aridum TaxID=2030 RepID=A0A428ZNM8_KIBAR|nr:fluoroquinolone transporter permease [Kibdelosporangium aridum]RSM89650.1 fluoroquinolone transporter permease [Kibdelosporangium aridum]